MAIDVGKHFVTGAYTNLGTMIFLENPANASGKIHSVEFNVNLTFDSCKIGTFYGTPPNLTCRSYANIPSKIGYIVASKLDIDVEVGDFLGIFLVGAGIRYETSGHGGIAIKAGDQFDAGQQTYTTSGYEAYGIAIFGVGGIPFIPSLFSKGDQAGKFAGTICYITKPNNLEIGDIIIGVLSSDGGSETHGSPESDSWIVIERGISEGSGKQTLSWWYKVVDGNEPSTLQFTCGSSERLFAFVIRVTGASGIAPIHKKGYSTGDSIQVSCPAVTTTVDNCVILRMWGGDHIDCTVDGGWGSETNIIVDFSDGSGGTMGGSAHKNLLSAGGSLAETCDLTGVEEWVGATIAIKPSTITHYSKNALVIVGTVVTASRTIGYTKTASVIVSILVTASRSVAYTRSALTRVGNLVSATRIKGSIKSSSVLVGLVASASRSVSRTRASSVIVGIVATASKVFNKIKTSSVIVGNVVSAIRKADYTRLSSTQVGVLATAITPIKGFKRSASTQVGILVTASKVVGTVRSALVLIGNLITASRAVSHSRTSSVQVGTVATAQRSVGYSRASSVITGIVTSASKIFGSVANSAVQVGMLVTASRAVAYVRSALTRVGILTTASRSADYIRASSTIVGTTVTATKVSNRIRPSSVIVGTVVTAFKSFNRSIASEVKVGILATASRLVAYIRTSSTVVGVVVTVRFTLSRNIYVKAVTTQYRKVKALTAQYRFVKVVTAQYRNLLTVTAQYRAVKALTAQYRRVKSIIFGG